MKYLISGGGTGGHIYPALAILDELKKQDPQGEFLYVGTPDGLERELATKAGYDYEIVRVIGLPRSISLESIKTGMELLKGLGDANRILKKFKPDIVIGTGGYVSFPVVFLAQIKKIKTMLQEANAFPGKVNRLLSKKADKIAIAFEEAKKRLPEEKCFISGNPIRPEFTKINRITSRQELGLGENEKLVLSFGGSGGQESINEALLDIFENNSDHPFKLIHITGRPHYKAFIEEIKNRNIELSDKIKILDYSHEIPKLLSSADVAILSPSAISLAEVSALGIPSILIPKSYTADNHQEFNARAFETAGASFVFLESELNSENLNNSIEEILNNERLMQKMSKCAKMLSKPNSTKIIVENIFEMLK